MVGIERPSELLDVQPCHHRRTYNFGVCMSMYLCIYPSIHPSIHLLHKYYIDIYTYIHIYTYVRTYIHTCIHYVRTATDLAV